MEAAKPAGPAAPLRPDQVLKQPDNGVTKMQMATQLPPNALQLSEFQYKCWSAHIPNGLTPQHLLEPSFWAIDAPKLSPFDEIRARAEDGTWMARFIVLETGRTWTRLQQLELHHLGTQDVSLTRAAGEALNEAKKGFEVKHRGPKGWSVIRKSDKQVMNEGAQTKAASEGWLDAYLRTIDSGAAPRAAAPAKA